jgi:hypothetical protein
MGKKVYVGNLTYELTGADREPVIAIPRNKASLKERASKTLKTSTEASRSRCTTAGDRKEATGRLWKSNYRLGRRD